MIYRPFTDYEGVDSGLWWSDNPYEDVSPQNKPASMGLDVTVARPLTQENTDFVSRHWAVASGKLDEIGDVFQDFQSFQIVVSEKVAEVIERFEPGLHDLVPIPNAWSLGSQQRIDKKLYFLNVHATARTVDMERADVTWVVRRSDGKKIPVLSAISTKKSVVYPNAEEGRHLRRDDITLAAFMSGALVAAMQDAQVLGFNFRPCTPVLH